MKTILFLILFLTTNIVYGAEPEKTSQPLSLEELKRQIDILGQEVQRLKIGEAAVVGADRSQYGLGPAASKVYRAEKGVSIGGYGELLYENFSKKKHDGSDSGAVDKINLLRGVIYFGYKFDDTWLFNSELEVENASTEGGGSVSMEFAYLDHLIIPEFNFRVGSILLPMGFINELHEPTVFLGAKRPDVETVLIPATWSENGFGFYGSLGAFNYKAYLTAGLDASKFTDTGIREGRQGGSSSIASNWATALRLDYVGIHEILLGSSAYFGKANTETPTAKGNGMAIPIGIYDLHLEWKWRSFQLRALGVVTYLGKIGELNTARNLIDTQSIGDFQRGGYLEAGYDFLSGHAQKSLIPFVRWESYETQAGVPTGFSSNPANSVKNVTLGANFKPIEQIVFKAEFKDYLLGNNQGIDQFDLSTGYVF